MGLQWAAMIEILKAESLISNLLGLGGSGYFSYVRDYYSIFFYKKVKIVLLQQISEFPYFQISDTVAQKIIRKNNYPGHDNEAARVKIYSG